MKEKDFIIIINNKIRFLIQQRDHARKYEQTLCKEINKLIKLLEKITGEK